MVKQRSSIESTAISGQMSINLLDLSPEDLERELRRIETSELNNVRRRLWSDKELTIVKRLYATIGPRNTQKYLPNRSLHAIMRKASDLGVCSKSEPRSIIN